MSLPPEYFDALYAGSADPWGFEGRWYEARKRALTLALLPEQRYGRVFEPGCSIGVLTRALAPRCGQLLASDLSPAAADAARRRCVDLPQVTVTCGGVPGDWPAGELDLVVLSELLYYLDPAAVEMVAGRAAEAVTVLAVHWRHPVADYPQSGDAVHAQLAAGLGAGAGGGHRLLGRYADDDLLAEVWSRDHRSVATRGGLS